jgi:hypothetical protein
MANVTSRTRPREELEAEEEALAPALAREPVAQGAE